MNFPHGKEDPELAATLRHDSIGNLVGVLNRCDSLFVFDLICRIYDEVDEIQADCEAGKLDAESRDVLRDLITRQAAVGTLTTYLDQRRYGKEFVP